MIYLKAIGFSFVLMVLFGSCKHQVVISAEIFDPHCGGAPPSLVRSNRPLSSQIIIVSEKDSLVVAFSDAGEAKIRLARGLYQWYQFSKSLTVEQTYAVVMEADRTLFEFTGIPCIEQWKKTVDGVFSVDSDVDTLKLVLRSNCYSRLVPCLKYTGPNYE